LRFSGETTPTQDQQQFGYEVSHSPIQQQYDNAPRFPSQEQQYEVSQSPSVSYSSPSEQYGTEAFSRNNQLSNSPFQTLQYDSHEFGSNGFPQQQQQQRQSSFSPSQQYGVQEGQVPSEIQQGREETLGYEQNPQFEQPRQAERFEGYSVKPQSQANPQPEQRIQSHQQAQPLNRGPFEGYNAAQEQRNGGQYGAPGASASRELEGRQQQYPSGGGWNDQQSLRSEPRPNEHSQVIRFNALCRIRKIFEVYFLLKQLLRNRPSDQPTFVLKS
jgi:hypothetical protein